MHALTAAVRFKYFSFPQPPGHTAHIIEIENEQYRVFSRDQSGITSKKPRQDHLIGCGMTPLNLLWVQC